MDGDAEAVPDVAPCPACGAGKSDGAPAAPAATDWDGNEYSHALPIQLLGSIDAVLGRRADGSGHAVLASTGMPISIGTDAQDAWNAAQDAAGRLGRRRLQGAIDQGAPVNGGTTESSTVAEAPPQDADDEMGQPFHGRSHFNRWDKMSEIWNSDSPLGDKLLKEWKAANYTVPDAQQRIDEVFGRGPYGGKPGYGLEFALGFPFTAPLGVGMALGADDRKLQLLDQASAGLITAGGALGDGLTTRKSPPRPMDASLNPGSGYEIPLGQLTGPRLPLNGTEVTGSSARSSSAGPRLGLTEDEPLLEAASSRDTAGQTSGLRGPEDEAEVAPASLKPQRVPVDVPELAEKGARSQSGAGFEPSPAIESVARGLQERLAAQGGLPKLEAWEDEGHEEIGPGSPRNPLGENVGYPDPAPRNYDGGFSPDTQVTDHRLARALRGHPTDPDNLHDRPWEENARKGGHEGNYLRERSRYIEQGLNPEQAEWVLEDYLRWIQNDVHATPVDPTTLNTLPSP